VRTLLIFTLCLLVATSICGAEPLDKTKYIGVEELKPGMVGYGLTVFKGTKPEKFKVEVVDVIPQMSPTGRPGQDAVIVKISGHDLEFTNIASGMSGSPVFFKGRIAGALAFGWSFSKSSICGMTPIKHMIEARDQADKRRSEKSVAVLERSFGYKADVEFVPAIMRQFFTGDDSTPKLGKASVPTRRPAAVMRPVMPVVCSGLSSEAIDMLNAHLAPNSMMAVAGGSASKPAIAIKPELGRDVKLEPGSAIGVRFSEGDMELSGSGTLTCFDKGRMLAFGHGMFQSGAIEMPLTTAWVHGFIPSSYMSFKLSTPMKTVGAIDYDGVSAVIGRLGAQTELLPIKLVVHGGVDSVVGTGWPSEKQGRVHNCKSIRHYMWTPLVGAIFVSSFTPDQGDLPRLSIAKAKFTIELADGRKINFSDMTAGPNAPRFFGSQLMMTLLDLYNNPFKVADLKSISVETAWSKGLKIAVINRVEVLTRKLSPGDTLEINLQLLTYLEGRKNVTMKVKIPKDMPYGALPITIGGFDSYFKAEASANPRRFRPRSFDELVKVYSRSRKRDKLYVWFGCGEYGMALGDAELPSLSAAALQVLGADADRLTGAMPITKLIVNSMNVPYLVSGQAVVALSIVPPEEK